MARLTKTDAARQLGIARATLYKLIAQGKLSPTAYSGDSCHPIRCKAAT
jgi:excisionase family DNA binding protein